MTPSRLRRALNARLSATVTGIAGRAAADTAAAAALTGIAAVTAVDAAATAVADETGTAAEDVVDTGEVVTGIVAVVAAMEAAATGTVADGAADAVTAAVATETGIPCWAATPMTATVAVAGRRAGRRAAVATLLIAGSWAAVAAARAARRNPAMQTPVDELDGKEEAPLCQ